METLEFNVDASANNIRIDRYLAGSVPGAFPFLYSETSQRRTGAR